MRKEKYEHIKRYICLLDIDRKEGLILNKNPWKNSSGYLMIHLRNKQVLVHQIIAFLKYGKRCIGMEVNHIDGNKENNASKNLNLVTREQNMKHAFKKGLCKHSRKRLSEKEVREIRNMLKDGKTQMEIAKVYNISFTTVSRIKRGLTYKNF